MEAYSFFPSLAELSPGKAVSASSDEVDLDVEVIFGPAEMLVSENALQIRLKKAYLALVVIGGSVVNGSRYGITLQRFKIKTAEKSTESRGSNLDARASGSIMASVSWMPALMARFGGEAQAARSSRELESKETILQSELNLIEPIAGSRWMIGGDIRKPGSFLLGSYFQESRDLGANKYAPLCRVEVKDPTKFRCFLTVQAKTYDFEFSSVGRWGADQKIERSDKEEFVRRMRAQVAGVVFQKNVSAKLKKIVGEPKFQEMTLANDLLLAMGAVQTNDIQQSER